MNKKLLNLGGIVLGVILIWGAPLFPFYFDVDTIKDPQFIANLVIIGFFSLVGAWLIMFSLLNFTRLNRSRKIFLSIVLGIAGWIGVIFIYLLALQNTSFGY